MNEIKHQTGFYLSILGLLFFVVFFQGIFTNLSTAAMRQIEYTGNQQVIYVDSYGPTESSKPSINKPPIPPEQIPDKPNQPVITPTQIQPTKPIVEKLLNPNEGPVKKPVVIKQIREEDIPTKPNMVWGAFPGNSLNDLEPFEKLVGQEVDIRAYFVGFGDSFPTAVANKLKGSGKTLLIYWEPYNTSVSSIAEGKNDTYIKNFAAQAKATGIPIMLAPFHEMNGNWDPWGGYNSSNQQINTPETITNAWKRIHSFFVDAKNVKFAWAVNNVSVPNITANDISVYYPGDAYVDYVGIDGFNFNNPWQTFTQVFDKAINKVSIYKKPIYIFSMGCVANPKKAEWITQGLGKDIYKYKIAGWVWFNQNGGDGNWSVNSDAASLEAFKAAIPK